MIETIKTKSKYIVTFIVVCLAAVSAFVLWDKYMNAPWTRDGRVRADVVLISPDIEGIVTNVNVSDNQFVHKGDLLFELDSERYAEAYKEAMQKVNAKEAIYQMKQHRAQRRESLDATVLSKESNDDTHLEAMSAKFEYNEALAKAKIAQINFERTKIYASCDGWVTNLLLKKGNYIKIGENALSLIDKNSFWVYGYFEENKIPFVHIGDKVSMNILGTNYTLQGHIQSIAKGITDRDNAVGNQLMANVNPIFTWVRLAQRVPVRINIDFIPENFNLIAGMTCTVIVKK